MSNPITRRLISLLLVVASVVAWGQYKYRQGYSAAQAAINIELAKTAARQAEKAHIASAQYEQSRTDMADKNEERKDVATKIITRTVYRNVCLDASGVQLINQAVADSNRHAGKP